MSPSLRNLFMKKLTRDRVVPIISANVSWLILGLIGCGLPSFPKCASRRRRRASRCSLELNNWSGGETAGKLDPKPASPAQLLYAKKLAQGKGLIIPDDARTNSAAMSAWINSNRGTKHRKNGRKATYKPAEHVAPQSAAPPKRFRKRKADTDAASMAP